jgi:membrane dipeptidase
LRYVHVFGLISLVLLGCSSPESGIEPAGTATPGATTTAAIHDRALTLDTHVDIPLDFATDDVDPMTANLQVNLEKMRSGGLDAAFFIVYVGQTERTDENYKQAQLDAMTKFNAIHRMTDELYPDVIGLATSADDVVRLNAEGKLVAAIGIENGYVIGKDLALLDRYYALGARYMTLVHFGHNDLGDSAQPREQLGDAPSEHDGLSPFGQAVVARMNELGMMVDISHAAKATALDAIAASRAPVIASHSGIAGVAAHPRNLDDETLMALKANGGVVQVVAYADYLKRHPPERYAAMRALEERLGLPGPTDPLLLEEDLRNEYLRGIRDIQQQWPEPTVEHLVDHIDYAVKLIGIDHVGISSDFGGGGGIIGWSDARETINVTAALIDRGYSETEIGKIWSGNLLRVWREVERVAATL